MTLALINQARVDAGLEQVTLGTNGAAQAHAEDMLRNCFSSHWNLQGLSPGARYAFAGGYQNNQEIVSGSDYCAGRSSGYRPIDLRQKVRDTIDGFEGSPSHWETILKPSARYVNIGLAWDTYNFRAALQFEADYVEYNEIPVLEGGVLTLVGTLLNGAVVYGNKDLDVYLEYRPSPTNLTSGQLARTYSIPLPLRAVAIRPPPPPGNRYTSDTYTKTKLYWIMPHEIDPDAHAPRSFGESHDLWAAAKARPKVERTNTVYWATADMWDVDTDAGTFRVVANVSKGLAEYGAGVYELTVFALIEGKPAIVSEYAFLYDISE